MAELVGNVLVGQSGGPTSVINASVAGIVAEALNHECIEEIYGTLNGVLGILQEDFIDLAGQSQQQIRALKHTPAPPSPSGRITRTIRPTSSSSLRFLSTKRRFSKTSAASSSARNSVKSSSPRASSIPTATTSRPMPPPTLSATPNSAVPAMPSVRSSNRISPA